MAILENVKQKIKASLEQALQQSGLLPEGEQAPDIILEVPKEKAHGDFSSNLAMQLTRLAKKNPRIIAETLLAHLDQQQAGISQSEIAGPGFINFFVDKSYLYEVIPAVIDAGDQYGSSSLGKGEKLQVEFVSANPTGSLHLGHARGAALGDALCRLLSFAGYQVSREYYINDAGNQVDNLARSLEVRYNQALGQALDMPEDGYYGEDIKKFAQQLADEKGSELLKLSAEERYNFFKEYGLEKEFDKIKRDLTRFGVEFDEWYSESSLYRDGKVEKALQALRDKGQVFEEEGASWLHTTPYGDDKDRVLVKQDGSYTYLTPDIAYHQDKFARGFDRLINIWGADHHGYIPRVKAAMSALGYESDRLTVLISQMVSLYQDGEKVKMSKRTGKAVTMEELMDEVGVDAIRYFFTMRSMDSHLDFDMDLAISKSNENPVFYVQYAHARICSIFAQAEEQSISFKNPQDVNWSALNKEAEFDLLLKMAEWSEEVEIAAQQLAPHRAIRYVFELASQFHSYYNTERVIIEDENLMHARLLLLQALRIVIRNVLRMIGVSAPEKM